MVLASGSAALRSAHRLRLFPMSQALSTVGNTHLQTKIAKSAGPGRHGREN